MSEVLKNRINTVLCIPVIYGVLLSVLFGCATESGEGADPGIVDQPIAYVKRTNAVNNNNVPLQRDARNPLLFSAGGDVYIRDRSSASANESNITATVTNGIGDVKDLEVSYDGTKLIFSLRIDDPDDNGDDDATWNIYEYDTETEVLSPLLDAVAAIEGDDIAPHYLPDGRIVFSSNRREDSLEVLRNVSGPGGIATKQAHRAIIEDRSVRVKILNIHVMDADGSNIKQISFNQSHDLDPVVLNDGNILFSRWDRAGSNNEINLYTMAPDGSNLQMYYGTHTSSHADTGNSTVQFTQPGVMPDGKIVSITRPFTGTFGGGDIVLIDAENYIDKDQPTNDNRINFAGTTTQDKATLTNVINDGSLSPFGRYSSVYPLRDGSNRILVSKGGCQITNTIIDPNDAGFIANIPVENFPCIEPYLSAATVIEMPSSYGIWIYDMSNHTELPIVIAEPGQYISDVVAMQPQTAPPVVFDKPVDAADEAAGVGILNIRSVYDFGDPNGTFDGCFTAGCTEAPNNITTIAQLADPTIATRDQRQARFLRIIKAVGLPDPDDGLPNLQNSAFGPNRNLGMKEIIGYTMIEPDGSVRVNVPADIAFGIEVLDKNGMRIGLRHDNWMQVNPGDELKCNGCHNHQAGVTPVPHGRNNAAPDSINPGVTANGVPFPNTENPLTMGDYLTSFQDTMAETRTAADADALIPSVDIIYKDRWDATAIPADDFEYATADLTTASPVKGTNCEEVTTVDPDWNIYCRIIINYIDHIAPIWEAARDDPMQAPGNNDFICTNCHSTLDEAAQPQSPQGQLNLDNATDSQNEPDHKVSYRELLFADELEGWDNDLGMLLPLIFEADVDVDGNVITPRRFNADVDIPDTTGLLLSDFVNNGNTVQSARSMTAGTAASSFFMDVMLDATRTRRLNIEAFQDHVGMLTTAEIKLLSEWLDIGAQYYNDPFDADAPQ